MEFLIENIRQDEIEILENEGFDHYLTNENAAVIEGDALYYAMALRSLRRDQQMKGSSRRLDASSKLTQHCSSVCYTHFNKTDAHENKCAEILTKNSQRLSENKEMAILLHDCLCNRDHNDQCSWFYEISEAGHDWTRFTHSRYLKMADKILDKGIHIETLSAVLDCIR